MSKSILDRSFQYTSAAATDIRKTFKRIERERKAREAAGIAEYDSWSHVFDRPHFRPFPVSLPIGSRR